MRLHLKNLSPECHGLIAKHKAEHRHRNLDETIECLVKLAMVEYKSIHEFSMKIEKEIQDGKRNKTGRILKKVDK